MREEYPRTLTEKEAAGMTVNERLYLSGSLERHDRAVAERNIVEISEVLKSVYLSPADIESIIPFELERK